MNTPENNDNDQNNSSIAVKYKPNIPTVKHYVTQFVHSLSSQTLLFAKL